jgi:hypothetical protein
LALLNTDYKLLARIIAAAVAAVREAVAYAEFTNAPLCILSIDFEEHSIG